MFLWLFKKKIFEVIIFKIGNLFKKNILFLRIILFKNHIYKTYPCLNSLRYFYLYSFIIILYAYNIQKYDDTVNKRHPGNLSKYLNRITNLAEFTNFIKKISHCLFVLTGKHRIW